MCFIHYNMQMGLKQKHTITLKSKYMCTVHKNENQMLEGSEPLKVFTHKHMPKKSEYCAWDEF